MVLRYDFRNCCHEQTPPNPVWLSCFLYGKRKQKRKHINYRVMRRALPRPKGPSQYVGRAFPTHPKSNEHLQLWNNSVAQRDPRHSVMPTYCKIIKVQCCTRKWVETFIVKMLGLPVAHSMMETNTRLSLHKTWTTKQVPLDTILWPVLQCKSKGWEKIREQLLKLTCCVLRDARLHIC